LLQLFHLVAVVVVLFLAQAQAAVLVGVQIVPTQELLEILRSVLHRKVIMVALEMQVRLIMVEVEV
jgi:hypothetical protein